MSIDIVDLLAFYASPLGGVARRVVDGAVRARWPNLRGLGVLGIGFATPYLGRDCERALAFMPGCQGVVNWPSAGASASALVDPLVLPLPDACVDRVLVVHGIEAVENPTEFLGEVWRVLTPGGRLLLVCPNRRGLWARMDRTPFGHGQPFSRTQLRHLLRSAQFAPERWDEMLYVPPARGRLVLRTAPLWERIGRGLGLPFAGLHVVDASKQLRRAVPVRAPKRVRERRAVLIPATSTREACDMAAESARDPRHPDAAILS